MTFGLFEDGREARKHLFSLAVSLVAHVAIIALLFVYFGSVKIINLNPNIATVLLAPPPPMGLQLPNVGPMPAGLPPVDDDYLDSIPVRRRPLPPPVEFVGQGGEGTGPPVEPRFTQGFRLEPPPERAPDVPSADSLRLPIPARSREPGGGAGSYDSPARPMDIERYLYSDAYGGLGSGLSGYSGYKPRRSGRRGGSFASPSVRSFDLAPWAASVTAAVQNNWNVPSLLSQTWGKTVEITAVILKNGRLFSAIVSEPSDDRSFDRAALEAVEESSPLPALPLAFPESSLEISFVFSRQ